jgi:hypothetical protein
MGASHGSLPAGGTWLFPHQAGRCFGMSPWGSGRGTCAPTVLNKAQGTKSLTRRVGPCPHLGGSTRAYLVQRESPRPWGHPELVNSGNVGKKNARANPGHSAGGQVHTWRPTDGQFRGYRVGPGLKECTACPARRLRTISRVFSKYGAVCGTKFRGYRAGPVLYE